MIYVIEAFNTKNSKKYTWNRNTIGNIIENIPKLIELDNCYKDIQIYEK